MDEDEDDDIDPDLRCLWSRLFRCRRDSVSKPSSWSSLKSMEASCSSMLSLVSVGEFSKLEDLGPLKTG